MASSTTGTSGTSTKLPSPRTSGPLGTNGDAADPSTPRWFMGDTPGPLGMNDYADPDTTMCRLRAATMSGTLAPTLGDARTGGVQRFEFEELELMSGPKFLDMPSATARKDWILSKLGRYDRQLYESAEQQQIPVQLLAVIITNELLDINMADLLQEEVELAGAGSFGIAQIQVDTALKDRLVPEDRQFQLAKTLGMERFFVKGRLRVAQYAIDAAAKEIRTLLDRMKANPDSAWLKKFDLKPGNSTNQDIYGGFREGSQEDKEAKLAEIVAAAYNSPDIIVAKRPDTYTNGTIHGSNAGALARTFYRWKLFRPACP